MMTSLGTGIATGYLIFVARGLIIAVGAVVMGSLVIAGMALAHGVVLPPL